MATLTNFGNAARELLADGFTFFLASNETVLRRLEPSPFGVELTPLDFTRSGIQPGAQGLDVTGFLKVYNAMNGLAFGPRGLPMPLWVMIDLALLPSALVIASLAASRLQEMATTLDAEPKAIVQQLLDEAERLGYDGPIPVGGYCAAPTADRDRWIGWSLCSVLPGRNLGVVVKGLALESYGARYLDGVTQFDNSSLRIHTRFGRLRIRSALLNIHTAANSFLYETDLTQSPKQQKDGSQQEYEEPTFLLDPYDTKTQAEMQALIESGERDFFILSPGLVLEHSRPRVPILEVMKGKK